MKKLKTVLLSLALFMIVVLGMECKTVQAEENVEFEEVKVTVLDDMTDFNTDVDLSWKMDFSLNEESGVSEQIFYAKFYLQQDSVVRVRAFVENEEAYSNDKEFFVYGNETMGTALLTNNMEFGVGDDLVTLKAGEYYMKCKSSLYMSGVSNHIIKVAIGAVPVSKAVTYTQKLNADKNNVTVGVLQHIAESNLVTNYEYIEGKVDKSSNVEWKTMKVLEPQFSATKNGWYTVRIYVESTQGLGQDIYYYDYVYVNGIDTVAPNITGVKENRYYRKAVTIKFNDVENGIKSALLNGKSMKSGKKITKDANYTLTVTDKAGNSKTVKFILDQKAPTTNIKAKTYAKAVKITFKDKTAGIKKVTLNGKSIKSGKKVSKNGSYTLKLTDKAGNKKTVKFKIKK